MMKFSAALLCFFASCVCANASDLTDTKKKAAAASNPDQTASISMPTMTVYDWTGFYAGIHGGYAFGVNKATLSGSGATSYANSLDIHPKGVIGGGQVGFNYQFSQLVTGLEIDGGYLGLNGSKTGLTDTTLQLKEKSTYYGTGTGRLGYSFDRLLAYGKGGVAALRIDDLLDGTNVSVRNSRLHLGYTVGGGIEFAVTDNISAKAEYGYMAFGKKTAGWTSTSGAALGTTENKTNVHAVMIGINYNFSSVEEQRGRPEVVREYRSQPSDRNSSAESRTKEEQASRPQVVREYRSQSSDRNSFAENRSSFALKKSYIKKTQQLRNTVAKPDAQDSGSPPIQTSPAARRDLQASHTAD